MGSSQRRIRKKVNETAALDHLTLLIYNAGMTAFAEKRQPNFTHQ